MGNKPKLMSLRKRKGKHIKCEKKLNKNDGMEVNAIDDNHEAAINLKTSSNTQIKEVKSGEVIKKEKSKEARKRDATEAASASNSPHSE